MAKLNLRRPKDKKEQFQILSSAAGVDSWRKYLELQVKLFAESEFDLFRSYGLGLKGRVLDLGCGPGLYSRALRKWDPSLKLVSADTNVALLKEFQESLNKNPDPGIEVVEWTAGEGAPPRSFKNCRSAILRYVLQHSHDPTKILSSLAKALPRGALVFIVEEDDGLYQFEPAFPAFERVIEIWKQWAKLFRADRLVGRKVPAMAVKAGLQILDLQVLVHSSHSCGIDALLEYFRLSFDILEVAAPGVFRPGESLRLSKAFQRYADQYEKNCFFYYPQVVTIARVV